jgi:hypothetical protein
MHVKCTPSRRINLKTSFTCKLPHFSQYCKIYFCDLSYLYLYVVSFKIIFRMLTQKTFVRKTRRGNIIKIVREHYLRDDIWCGSPICKVPVPVRKIKTNKLYSTYLQYTII